METSIEWASKLCDLSAEQSVIGSMLIDPDSIHLVEPVLKSDDFFLKRNGDIFESILFLKNARSKIDIITVQDYLKKKGLLRNQHDALYIIETASNAISSASIENHARIVLERSKVRKALDLMKKQIGKIESGTEIDKTLHDSIEQLTKLATGTSSQRFFERDINSEMLKHFDDELASDGCTKKIKMGFSELDEKINSYKKGSLVVVAGRPSMGKTAFALNLYANAIHQKKTAVFYSFEMGLSELYLRIASNTLEKELKTGSQSELLSVFSDLLILPSKISHEYMKINDDSITSLSDIRFQCERLKAKSGLDLVIIDYLQILPVADVRRNELRERVIAEASRELKFLARTLDVPVVVLSQLNRGVESRVDKRPLLSDLRESGAIEQDADLVLLLYREDYYEREASFKKGICEIIIAKQRNGPTGSVELQFRPEICKFY